MFKIMEKKLIEWLLYKDYTVLHHAKVSFDQPTAITLPSQGSQGNGRVESSFLKQ